MIPKISDRDRASLLLSLLTNSPADHAPANQPPDDGDAALRLASHTALNLAGESGTEALWELGRALPWLAVYLDWTNEDIELGALAATITRRRLVTHLPAPFVLQDLERGERLVKTSPIRRAPQTDVSPKDHRALSIARIAGIDRRLEALLREDDAALLDGLLEDTSLLDAALVVARAGEDSTATVRLRDILPAGRSKSSNLSLRILATIEESGFESLPEEFSLLEDRGRRFELSLADNMHRHGLLETVRAALAFGPAAPGDDVSLNRSFFFQFSAFATDPSLEGLTRALVEMRRRCLGHLRGALPLEALSPWVDYLRGGCAELAETRGITLREAIHFAHYCLHLVNICDLAAVPGLSLREPLRRAMMDIEDELKEFALVGQREGLSDTQSRLERYDRSRWLSRGPRAYVVDRLARLHGGWRKGTRPGPIGAPPRLHEEFVAPCEAALDELDLPIESLANLLARAQLLGVSCLEHLEAKPLLELLILAGSAARDLPHVDISQPFVVDCSPLELWCAASPAQSDRVRLLQALLEQYPTTQLLEGSTELTHVGLGLVAEAVDDRLVLRFVADAELEALLTLLTHTAADRQDLRDVLSNRLEEMLFDADPIRSTDTRSKTSSSGSYPPPSAGSHREPETTAASRVARS
ncbi:MAG: hypothetical protein ACNA8W_14255 [Bradymonadaceae bacterium]